MQIRTSLKPPNRNPITQVDVEVPKKTKHNSIQFEYSSPRNQGIAMGTFAEKAKQSKIFAEPEAQEKPSRKYIPHSASETYIPTVSLKKSSYQPQNRNPIVQEPINDSSNKIRSKITQSTAFAHLLEDRQDEHKPRNNIYYEHMKRDIFAQEEPQKVPRTRETQASEVGSILIHDTPSISIANDPTKNKIAPQDLMQKKFLGDNAKLYSVRRNESAITFASY